MRHPVTFASTAALIAISIIGLASCSDVPTEGENSIYAAAQYGDMAALRDMLAGGFDVNTPDENGMTLLHYAAGGNQPDVIEMLTNEYAGDVHAKDNQGRTPLEVAKEAGSREAYYVLEQNM